MRRLTGIPVSPGNAVGPAVLVAPPQPLPPDETGSGDLEADLTRVTSALATVSADLQARAGGLDGDAAEMVGAAAQIALDPGLVDATRAHLAAGLGPATALDRAVEDYAEQFRALGGYFAERVADLRDVGDRAVAIILGRPVPGVPEFSQPSIVIAEDLAPAETSAMDPALVVGLVTSAGGRTSHTAILAAQRGIPAIVQARDALEVAAGTVVALDADAGELIIEPDHATIIRLAGRRQRQQQIHELTGGGATADGHAVPLLGNVGGVADSRVAAAAGAEGVGLFRTEFVFLDASTAPTRAEQSAIYTDVLRCFPSLPVTVRTLDAGADKPLAFADLGPEPNPALGRRGLRLNQVRTDLLDDQLGALADAQAATGAVVKVMAPMVATPEEAAWFVDRAHAAGLDHAGTMIEVPAAALRAADVLAVCDFASLGTNDLAQYTMAADRMVGELSDLLDPWQPAVLDLVGMACEAGRRRGKAVGVCGESGGDPLLALVLVGLGVTTLSMASSRIPLVRWALSRHTRADCERFADVARSATSARAAHDLVLAVASPELTDLL